MTSEANQPTQFFQKLERSELPVVVDFWAPWCAPCRAIAPGLKRLGQEYAGRVEVWKVNADEQPELLHSLGIFGIPTLIVYRSGEEVLRKTGAPSPEGLKALFEVALSGERPVKTGPSRLERLLRLGAGLFLLFLGYAGGFSGLYLLLALLGAGVVFSAVHDRCPLWRALAPRLASLLDWEAEDAHKPA